MARPIGKLSHVKGSWLEVVEVSFHLEGLQHAFIHQVLVPDLIPDALQGIRGDQTLQRQAMSDVMTFNFLLKGSMWFKVYHLSQGVIRPSSESVLFNILLLKNKSLPYTLLTQHDLDTAELNKEDISLGWTVKGQLSEQGIKYAFVKYWSEVKGRVNPCVRSATQRSSVGRTVCEYRCPH